MIEDQVLLNRSEKEFTHSAGFVRLGGGTFKFINLECERTALMSLISLIFELLRIMEYFASHQDLINQ